MCIRDRHVGVLAHDFIHHTLVVAVLAHMGVEERFTEAPHVVIVVAIPLIVVRIETVANVVASVT